MSKVIKWQKKLVNSVNETLQNELGLGLIFISPLKKVQKHCVSEIRIMLAVILSCTYGKGSWKDTYSSSICQELQQGKEHTVTLNREILPALLMCLVFPTLKQSSSSNTIILGKGGIRVVEN